LGRDPTSFASYVNEARGRTSYLAQARVLRREGHPYPVCGTPDRADPRRRAGHERMPRCQPAP
jgi:hypothetical protein